MLKWKSNELNAISAIQFTADFERAFTILILTHILAREISIS